jgi:hypothetical protein
VREYIAGILVGFKNNWDPVWLAAVGCGRLGFELDMMIGKGSNAEGMLVRVVYQVLVWVWG